MTDLTFREGVRAAAPYIPDWLGLDRHDYVRLDRNEATGPLSGYATEAIVRHLRERGVHAYPDEGALADEIGAYCGVPGACVLATNGSDQAIDLCLRAFLGPGGTMLVARPEFAIFGHTATLQEATVRGVPFDEDLNFPYERFRAELADPPSLIVFINPNNPTGTPVDIAFVEEVARAHPDVPVLVDEAYVEFTGQTAVPLIAELRNVVVLRTFSKAFAMAGLRLGYIVADPAVVAELTKIRNPFDVNVLAMVAAREQLRHLDDVHHYVEDVMTVVKPATVEFFTGHGIVIHPGAANFVLVRPDDYEGTLSALFAAGILVRPMGAPALAGTFRMSIGTRAEMDRVFEVFDGLSKV